MTDPTTDLGTIWVVGQRRRPGGSFPAGGGSGGGGGIPGDDGGIHQDEVDPDGGSPDGSPTDPCLDTVTAQEWNIDAAAAAAAAEFDRLGRAAGEDGINDRERGAFLYRRADGSIGFGPLPIAEGPLFSEGGEFVSGGLGDIDPGSVVGYIHSHPQGSHRPSGPSPRVGLEHGDLGFFNNYLVPLMANNGATPRMYIVARNEVGAGQTPYNQINVYDETNIESSINNFEEGPEVNPDGAPCPGQ